MSNERRSHKALGVPMCREHRVQLICFLAAHPAGVVEQRQSIVRIANVGMTRIESGESNV
jgi:hypothetical protein